VQRSGVVVEVPVDGHQHAAQVAPDGEHVTLERGPDGLIQRVLHPVAALDRARRRARHQRHARCLLLLLLLLLLLRRLVVLRPQRGRPLMLLLLRCAA
jgi:hypothetical protein